MEKNNKKSFVLYTDTYESIKDLSNEQKGILLNAIFVYAQSHDLIKLDSTTKMAFSFIRQYLDRDEYSWNEKIIKRRLAGSMGGKQRVANQANATFAKQTKQNQTNQAVSANENVNVNKKFFSSKAMPLETAHKIFAELAGGNK